MAAVLITELINLQLRIRFKTRQHVILNHFTRSVSEHMLQLQQYYLNTLP